MSPTIYRERGLRFHFFSREEERMHVHVTAQSGEAKFWLEPSVSVASAFGLSDRELRLAERIIMEHSDEFISAWKHYFGN